MKPRFHSSRRTRSGVHRHQRLGMPDRALPDPVRVGGNKMVSRKGAKARRRREIFHTKTQRWPFRPLSSACQTSAGRFRCRTKSGLKPSDARSASMTYQPKPPSLCLCVRPDAASRQKPPATDHQPVFAPLRLCVRLFFLHRHQRRGHILRRINPDHRRFGRQRAHVGHEGARHGQRNPGSRPG